MLCGAIEELETVKREIKINTEMIAKNSQNEKERELSNLGEFESNDSPFVANANREALSSIRSLTSVKLNLLESCLRWTESYVRKLPEHITT
jgi:hypothetical protein